MNLHFKSKFKCTEDLDKTCSYKWSSSRLIFPRINGPNVKVQKLLVQNTGHRLQVQVTALLINN